MADSPKIPLMGENVREERFYYFPLRAILRFAVEYAENLGAGDIHRKLCYIMGKNLYFVAQDLQPRPFREVEILNDIIQARVATKVVAKQKKSLGYKLTPRETELLKSADDGSRVWAADKQDAYIKASQEEWIKRVANANPADPLYKYLLRDSNHPKVVAFRNSKKTVK